MRIVFGILTLCFVWNFSFSQKVETEFTITDRNGEVIYFLQISINDTISLIPDLNYKYITKRELGSYHITSEYYGYKVIDTTIVIKQNNQIIQLSADLLKDALLKEFAKGFKKIYYSDKHSIVIGLKEDNTFIIKSFFHTSLAACFQFEKGKYRIENSTLILNVFQYECPCYSTNKKFIHEYRYNLINEEIMDFGKYSGFIERTYFGLK